MMADDDKTSEPKTERFNMFMSPTEMKAIDDWAWKSRIRSKSEAVRRLCQVGLLLEELLETSLDRIIAGAQSFNKAVKSFDATRDAIDDLPDSDEKAALRASLKQLGNTFEEMSGALTPTREFFEQMDFLYVNVDVDAALSDLEKLRKRQTARRSRHLRPKKSAD